MKQVVQSVRSGELRVVDVPRPSIGPTEVLVATSHSVISSGTERAVRDLASASLLGKARARPDLVRQVLRKARSEGVAMTLRSVRSRLDEEMPLGYSGAGTVVEQGEAVAGIVPGQQVATGSAGHAELQVVPAHLAVPTPDGVSNEEAAFATIASIALHGLRLADLGPGSKVCVIGLGLLGQLAVRVAQAAGHDVAGIDLREWSTARAAAAGALALVDTGAETHKAIIEWSRGRGADAVLLTAATPSSDPVKQAVAVARDRAVVVVIGDVGLELQRAPLYEKEITLRLARSYGPGRYEVSYEQWGIDYPPGHVRWTEGRNLEAVLDLLASGRLSFADLVTHRFPISEATAAYRLIESADEPHLGVELTYPDSPVRLKESVAVAPRRSGGEGIGLLGAGKFSRATLVPALQEAGFSRLVSVAAPSGVTARHLAERVGFEHAVSRAELVIEDPDVEVVFVASRHDSHAALTAMALEAGKHVFCEKPLALTVEELLSVRAAWRAGPGHLMVGFNRRWSEAVALVRGHMPKRGGPLVVNYRVSAGTLPTGHWYGDRRQGGRLVGEACHFIDTCNAVVGAPVESVVAAGSGRSEVLLEEDLIVTLRYDDGSVATISHGSGGHAATPKERVEILGRGHSATIDDFRHVVLDERRVKQGAQDKGHVAELRAFRKAIREGTDAASLTEPALSTMAATFAAVESLRTRSVIRPSDVVDP